MIRRHLIRLQILSIPFTTKQRRMGDTRAGIDNRSPETSRIPATKATLQQIGANP
jgi:hypothetical protein